MAGQQGGSEPLDDRPAEGEDRQGGRHRGQGRAHPVDDDSDQEHTARPRMSPNLPPMNMKAAMTSA